MSNMLTRTGDAIEVNGLAAEARIKCRMELTSSRFQSFAAKYP